MFTEPDITQLLVAWANGDPAAFDRLEPAVHQELHRLASRYMAGERRGHVLQTTALLNEAYMRLVGWKDVQWQSRTGADTDDTPPILSADGQPAMNQLAGFNGEIKSKDDVTVAYRLQATGQDKPRLQNSLSAKAKSNGEDVMTPLLLKAAEGVLTEVAKK
jgi:ECF sigma factor